MKFHLLRKVIFTVMFIVLISCSKSSNGGGTTPPNPTPPPTTTTAKLMTLPPGWKLSSSFSIYFPAGIELYYFDSIYAGKKTKMFCLAYDSKNPSIEFKPVLSATAKKNKRLF